MRYHETPVQEIVGIPILERAGVRLLVKREDCNHPEISGNKWWKLKYNIAEASASGRPIVTFGGAWSNHIYATAAASFEAGLRSTGIIRGEKIMPLNATLAFASEKGMQFRFVDRSTYRLKNSAAFVAQLQDELGDFYLIPEGGTNELAVKGCAEFAQMHLADLAFDHLFLPVGTGGTMAGIVAGLADRRRVAGVAVLKGGDFLNQEVRRLVDSHAHRSYSNWHILTDYHLGGYARTTPDLIEAIRKMKDHHNLPLDHVYTAKAFMAILSEAGRGRFARGETVLLLHTGGLQGSRDILSAKTS